MAAMNAAQRFFAKRLFSLWGPVGFWCGLIFILSAIPDLNSGLEYDYPLRKLAHMTEYAILLFLSRRAMAGTWGGPMTVPSASKVWDRAALVFTILYAMSDEYHQSFVGGRTGAWSDVGIDSVGAFLAFSAIAMLRMSSRRK